jgi:hypothetical protein
MTETEIFKELRGKLGEETSEKLISFIQNSQQKRFEERWDQLVTKDILQQELRSFQTEIHKVFRTQLRWLLPLLFGQLGILLALLVKMFLDG